MLGTFGFSAAAIAFFAYGFTSRKFALNDKVFLISEYTSAYYSAALACVFWAIGTRASGSELMKFVVLGDGFVLLASIFLFRVLLANKHRLYYTVLAIVIAIGALIYRSSVTTLPIMKDGVLVFYTPRLFGAFLIVVLLAVWLRANMAFYDKLVNKAAKLSVFRTNFYATNLVGIIGVCGFLFAHKSITIAVSFSMLIVALLGLSALNYVILNPAKKEVNHAK